MQHQNSMYCKHCGNQHQEQDCAVNPTIFEWKYDGTSVQLYGSWSHFQVGYNLTKSKHPPFFLTTQINPPLPPGTYEYIFSVDGEWKHDPCEQSVINSFGSLNNQIQVLPRRQLQVDSDGVDNDDAEEEDVKYTNDKTKETVRITIKTDIDCNEMHLKGSWDNWTESILLTRKFLKFAKKYINYACLNLSPGSYQYKFIVANQWIYDQTQPTVDNGLNSKNNIIHVPKKSLKFRHQNLNKVYFTQYQLTHKFDRLMGLSLTAIGNEFYLFGGRGTGSDYKNDLYVLNPRTKDLRLIYDFKGISPEQRAFHNAIRYGNKIIFYGGLNSEQVFNDYYVFNTTNTTWTQSKPKGQVPTPREKSSLTLLQNYQILVQFGGYYCSHDLEVQIKYNEINCLDLTNMVWTKYDMDKYSPKPPERSAHTATAIKDKIYIFGGQSLPQGHMTPNFNDLWMIDFSQENATWTDLTKQIKGEPPKPRHGHCAVQLQHQIYIFGGRGENSDELMNDLFRFDPDTLIWSKPEVCGNLPIPRCFFAAETIQNSELWLVGGHKGNLKAFSSSKAHIYVMSFEEQEEDDTMFTFSPQITQFKGIQHEFIMETLDSIIAAKTK